MGSLRRRKEEAWALLGAMGWADGIAAPLGGAPSGGLDYAAYIAKVLTIDPTNLIQFLKLDETSGTNANDTSAENNDGTYNAGVTLNASTFQTSVAPVPRWDGTGDVLNIYSAGLAADFSVTEFTLAAWVRVFDSGVWADGVDRRVFTITADGNNSILLRKAAGANSINMNYTAGATVKQVQTGSQSSTDWIHYAITVSKSNDRMRSYINGAQVGSTQTGLGVWVGAINSATVVIGGNSTAASANIWNGWLANTMIWKAELTAANVLALATYP